MRFLHAFHENTVFYESKWPSEADFLDFFDEIKRPKNAKNYAQSDQNASKIAFSHFFFLFARGARERDFTKVGRVKPGWHGNGKRVSFLTRFVRNFAGVSAGDREKPNFNRYMHFKVVKTFPEF